MARPSPRDLATAFASFSRRLGEARGELPVEESSPVEQQVLDLCAVAGMEMGVPFAALPDAIRGRPAGVWGCELEALEGYAMRIGALLRRIEFMNTRPRPK
jgi:hypothetical protein